MSPRPIVAGLAICTLLLSSSCTKDHSKQAGNPNGDSGATKILRFSAIPDENTTEQSAKFRKFADYLSSTLRVKAEFVPAADYGASVDKFVNGEIHLAWFGGLTGVQARAEVADARAIAQGIEDSNYISYFIANADTGLKLSESFPAAIKDMKFTFSSKTSTSGRLMPSFFIEKETGIEAIKWFANPVGFSGAHDKTAKLVEAGTFQAGVLSYKKYDSMVENGDLDATKCRIIWKTPAYANYNWTAHPDLDVIFGGGFINKLQEALIEIDDPALLKALTRARLIPANNDGFQGIVDVARQLKLLNH